MDIVFVFIRVHFTILTIYKYGINLEMTRSIINIIFE